MAIVGRTRFAAVVAAGDDVAADDDVVVANGDDDNYDYDYVDDYVNGDDFDGGGGGVTIRLLGLVEDPLFITQ